MSLFAKKSLGQHFLTSKHVLGQIMTAARITSGETILEIGPGTGVLTARLLESEARVIAIEKDARAIGLLKEKFQREIEGGMLKLIEGDILDQELFTKQVEIEKPFALVANIPYYITGAILEQFLEHGPRPDRMVLLVQREVAERIVARDGKESILSVSVKAFGTPKLVAVVPPGAFTPPPSVDSAILSIESISDSEFCERNILPARFFEVVRAGFAHKRKLALRNLEETMKKEAVSEAWKRAALDPKARAEDIPVRTWFDIAMCA